MRSQSSRGWEISYLCKIVGCGYFKFGIIRRCATKTWTIGFITLLLLLAALEKRQMDNVVLEPEMPPGKVPPHIIYIMADDLGWNDVGFHGSNHIPTPNIDALAYSGVILNQFYVNHVCSPSRGALMTGLNPIHTGLQNVLIGHMTPFGLPLQFKTLPEYLKSHLGYKSHLVGKWHLGGHRQAYTPTERGFSSHLGTWHGITNYYTKRICIRTQTAEGYDFRSNMRVAWEHDSEYVTDILTKESARIISNHKQSQPLFLFLSHVAPHGPLLAPKDLVDKYAYLKTPEEKFRDKLAAVIHKMDESVGTVVKALKTANMLKDSIIVFTTDNGGAGAGYDSSSGSNYPLRGMKSTLFEGGVRGVAAIWSPLIQNRSRVSKEMITIHDVLPTLLTAAKGKSVTVPKIDGMNVWNSISQAKSSPRDTIFHGAPTSRLYFGLRHRQWKLVYGAPQSGRLHTSWHGAAERTDAYDVDAVLGSITAKTLRSIGLGPPTRARVLEIRRNAIVECDFAQNGTVCNPLEEMCLFDLEKDPCEMDNLYFKLPKVAAKLSSMVTAFSDSAVKSVNCIFDPKADPKFWNYTWTNWRDFTRPQSPKKVFMIDQMKTRLPSIFDVDIQRSFSGN